MKMMDKNEEILVNEKICPFILPSPVIFINELIFANEG